MNKVLRLHKLFLNRKDDGESADLSRADLSSAKIIKTNMEDTTITLTKKNIEVLKQLIKE